MAFSGIATYDPGAPPGEEIAEDVSALVQLISRADTPLLDYLGMGSMPAESTHHEWLDDALIPNRSLAAASAASGATGVTVTTGEGVRFRAGDVIKASLVSTTAASSYARDELLLVTAVSTDTLAVTRAYGGTTAAAITLGDEIQRVSRAALEGDDSPGTTGVAALNRRSNWCQIFTEDAVVSGTRNAVKNLGGIGAKMDYEIAKRVKEILVMLESSIVQGYAPASVGQGSATVARTMDGLIAQITANTIDGSAYSAGITEAGLNLAFRTAWDAGAKDIDLILVNGYQKRAINQFILSTGRWYAPEDKTFKNQIATYESDTGTAVVMLSRWVPRDMVIGLDTSRFEILNMAGRSFFTKPIAEAGDYTKQQVIGEYTNELRNGPDGAHFIISDIPFTK